ncbi:MAG: hypothetical protein L6Q78_02780 [Bacteroidia bacterium]|nr:hypothetical protein [Bacteroidia bacterium]
MNGFSKFVFGLPAWLLFVLYLFPFFLMGLSYSWLSIYELGAGEFGIFQLVFWMLNRVFPLWLLAITQSLGREQVKLRILGWVFFVIQMIQASGFSHLNAEFFDLILTFVQLSDTFELFWFKAIPYLISLGFTAVAAESLLILKHKQKPSFKAIFPFWILMFFFPVGVWVLQPMLSKLISRDEE